ncbi:MAG: hypothetical protein HKN43_08210 [Rhodothermales bacterium]|nr:hypothetical protein [Rhodothermales bacterium]
MAANTKNDDGQPNRHDTLMRLKRHTVLSVLTFLIGVALVVIVGYVEDDPIIPPFIMIAVGAVWFIVTRAKIRSHHMDRK